MLEEPEIQPVQPRPSAEKDLSYSERLFDFGDEDLAQKLAKLLHNIIKPLARMFPLYELDGFTLALDYQAALEQLDRGDSGLPPVTSGATGYGQGVIMRVAVIRDGVHKEHIVVAGEVVGMWLSPDEGDRLNGVYTLCTVLAGVAHSIRYSTVAEVSFPLDSMYREFHPAIATSPTNYWSAKQVAAIAPDKGKDYADLVLGALEFAEREIADERIKMRDDSDIESATARALQCVSAILSHASHWLGHRDGLAGLREFAGADLPEQLEGRGLSRWI